MAIICRFPSLDLGESLRGMCGILVSSHPAGARMEAAYSFPPGCRVPPGQAEPLVRAVRELVANAIEHAHPTHVRGRLRVGCRQDAEGGVVLEVIDDGVGLPEGFDPAVQGGAGLRLVRALCRGAGARLSFESTALGLIVRIAVPGVRAESGHPGISEGVVWAPVHRGRQHRDQP
ncbi:MAG: sensor histidine kinase [Rhodospirillales bacterium]|nr:sensor histidine kinase [Rhodospirillales bacterium]